MHIRYPGPHPREVNGLMSAPAEVLAYLQTLVWPSVVIAGIVIFRRQVGNLIPRISEISAAGASVKFAEEVTELANKASSLAQDVIETAPDSAQLPTPPRAIEPTALFLEAYRELEVAARDAAPAAGVRGPNPTPIRVIEVLARKGLIPDETVPVADELRKIRNDVAHGVRRLDALDAENLANTARSLALICIASIPRPDLSAL
jgi:hypothetical protein